MSRAVKVVARQLRELQDDPIENVAIQPTESNFLNCCCNIKFPEYSNYPGLILHIWIDFPSTYPNDGPNVELKTWIDHSHVFFPKICFSLLSDFELYFKRSNSSSGMWNPSISIRVFLLELYEFLTVDSDREIEHRKPITETERTAAKREATNYKCNRCGHTLDHPCPSLPSVSTSAPKCAEDTFCDATVLTTPMGPIVLKHHSAYEEAYNFFTCYFQHKNPDQDFIGFGIRKRYSSRYPEKFQTRSDFEPISYSAFSKYNIRKLKSGKLFSHWIPFVIGKGHWNRCKEIAKRSIADFYKEGETEFQPLMFVDVIGTLFSHLLQRYGADYLKYKRPIEHRMQHLAMLHHFILAFVLEYKEIAEYCDSQLEKLRMCKFTELAASALINPLFYCVCSSKPVESYLKYLFPFLFYTNFSLVTKKYPSIVSATMNKEVIKKAWDAIGDTFISFGVQVKWMCAAANGQAKDLFDHYEQNCGRLTDEEVKVIVDETKILNKAKSFRSLEKSLKLREQGFDSVSTIKTLKSNLPTITIRTHYDLRPHGPGARLAVLGTPDALGGWDPTRTTAFFAPARVCTAPPSPATDTLRLIPQAYTLGQTNPSKESSAFVQGSIKGANDSIDDVNFQDIPTATIVDDEFFYSNAVEVTTPEMMDGTSGQFVRVLDLNRTPSASLSLSATNGLLSDQDTKMLPLTTSTANKDELETPRGSALVPLQVQNTVSPAPQLAYEYPHRSKSTTPPPVDIDDADANDRMLPVAAYVSRQLRLKGSLAGQQRRRLIDADVLGSPTELVPLPNAVAHEVSKTLNSPGRKSVKLIGERHQSNVFKSPHNLANRGELCDLSKFTLDETSKVATPDCDLSMFSDRTTDVSSFQSSIDQNDDGNTLVVRVTLCPHSVVFWKMAVVCDQKVVRWEDGENRILEVGGEGQNKEIVVWWNQK